MLSFVDKIKEWILMKILFFSDCIAISIEGFYTCSSFIAL